MVMPKLIFPSRGKKELILNMGKAMLSLGRGNVLLLHPVLLIRYLTRIIINNPDLLLNLKAFGERAGILKDEGYLIIFTHKGGYPLWAAVITLHLGRLRGIEFLGEEIFTPLKKAINKHGGKQKEVGNDDLLKQPLTSASLTGFTSSECRITSYEDARCIRERVEKRYGWMRMSVVFPMEFHRGLMCSLKGLKGKNLIYDLCRKSLEGISTGQVLVLPPPSIIQPITELDIEYLFEKFAPLVGI